MMRAMDRRRFLEATAGMLAVGATQSVFAGQTPPAPAAAAPGPPPPRPAWSKKHAFKLKYAPHFGMFENSAGKDLFDQLKFMADQGFTALEDNGMMGRTPELQAAAGRRDGQARHPMGVFVIQTGGNNSDRFTTRQAGEPGEVPSRRARRRSKSPSAATPSG